MNIKGLIFSVLLLALLIGGVVAFSNQYRSHPVACTTEAKICPDGSAVGRTGPKCEFAPCPVATSTSNNGAGDEGDPDSTVVITQDDMGKIVHVPIDQNFRLELSDLKWKFTLSNPSIVKQITTESLPASSQALFNAISSGTTTLSGVGAPNCKPNEMCAQFLVNFTVTIVVDK